MSTSAEVSQDALIETLDTPAVHVVSEEFLDSLRSLGADEAMISNIEKENEISSAAEAADR